MECHVFFFFNDTATTEIYTLSLHDALPIRTSAPNASLDLFMRLNLLPGLPRIGGDRPDRKSTRLNSSHVSISYAVFCLKKKIVLSKAIHRDRHFDALGIVRP